MKNLDATLGWIGARLQEGSSAAAIMGFCLMFHIGMDPGLAKSIAYLGAGVGGILAFAFPDKGSAAILPVPDRALTVAN